MKGYKRLRIDRLIKDSLQIIMMVFMGENMGWKKILLGKKLVNIPRGL